MSDRINDEIQFDVFADVMETLRFRGTIFFRSDLAAPWGMSLNQTTFPRFHIMLSGSCFVGVGENRAVEVLSSDIIMLPGGGSHWIADQPGRDLVPSSRASEACELNTPLFQQGETTNRIICGMVRFEQNAVHPFLDALPAILHFSHLKEVERIWMTVKLIEAEMSSGNAPGGLLIDRLTEVLFLQLLNRYVSSHQDVTGFLAALRDRRTHQVLQLIHKEPNRDWTPEVLGSEVGMSKATLNRKFQDTVGTSPIAYLQKWRIMKAYSLVKYSLQSLEQIADLVGFSSARTLTKAFKRHYGYTPQELRRKTHHQHNDRAG